MNPAKKMILAAAFLGILGFGGVARATANNPSFRTATLATQSTEVTQVREKNQAVINSQETKDLTSDRDSEVNDDKIPISLSQVGEYGEIVYDTAKVNDWTKTTTELTKLQNAAKQLSTQVNSGDTAQLNLSISALNKAVAAKDRQTTMQNANQVTLVAAKMTAEFKPKVPVEITLLDYYGRELEIWSATGNTAKLKTTTSEMRSTWNQVRPTILARGGTTQAQTFDRLVAGVETAKSHADYSRLATPVLNEVDNLEKGFK